MESPQDLQEGLQDIVGHVLPCTDEEARAFFQRFPLDHIFRALQGEVDNELADLVQRALGSLFLTEYGKSLLPSATPYAVGALGASAPSLRRLGCKQLGHILQTSSATGIPDEALQALLRTLADDDTGVSLEAEKALLKIGANETGFAALCTPTSSATLQSLVRSSNPIVRMRALAFAVKLACTSAAHAKAVQNTGLLEPLLEELRNSEDTLTCLTALEMVRELAGGADAETAGALASSVIPVLLALITNPDPLLQSQALKVAAAVLRASRDAEGEAMAIDGVANGHVVHPLLVALKEILDVNGTREVPEDVEEGALDAVGELGASRKGAQLFLEDPTNVAADVAQIALGRAGGRERRICALHALAGVGGAERSRGVRQEALLDAESEDLFQSCIYSPISGAAAYQTLPEVLLGFLQQPFPELRIATYRFLVAVALRLWGASEICLDSNLLTHILQPSSEVGRDTSEWRYAAVQALSATVAHYAGAAGLANGVAGQADALAAAAEDIQRSVRQGVYGSGSGGLIPSIATRAGG